MPEDSRSLYETPVADLSQGDIIEISPHVFLDPPLIFVDRQPDGAVILYQSEISQVAGQKEIVATCKPAQALIVNYDCEIAQEKTVRLVVCPIVSLSSFPPADQGNVKRNRKRHLFFLPRFQGKLEDSVVVLNQMTTIHRLLLCDLRRVATLTATGRLAFYAQFVRWLTRWELRNIPCPKCGTEFDPTLALPVRSAGDK